MRLFLIALITCTCHRQIFVGQVTHENLSPRKISPSTVSWIHHLLPPHSALKATCIYTLHAMGSSSYIPTNNVRGTGMLARTRATNFTVAFGQSHWCLATNPHSLTALSPLLWTRTNSIFFCKPTVICFSLKLELV